jgi:hypothetical protein
MPAPAAPAGRVTIPQARAAQKESDVFREETAKLAAKNVGDEQKNFELTINPVAVSDRKRSSERVINLVTKYPDAVGVLASPDIMNAFLTVARDGVNTPSGAIGMRTIEDALVLAIPGTSPEVVNARKEIQQNLARGALEASKLSQGQGTVSDFERLMFEKIAGSLADTPELLVKRQKMLVARADLDKELGTIYRASKQTNRALNYDEFRNSPQFISKVEAYDKRIQSILDEDIKIGKGAGKGADLSKHPGMKLLNSGKYSEKPKQ